MKLLILCLVALLATTTGAIVCEGTLQHVFQIGFFISLGASVLLLLSGATN